MSDKATGRGAPRSGSEDSNDWPGKPAVGAAVGTRALLVVLLLLGLAGRVGMAVRAGLDLPPESGSDSQEYDRYAENLASGRGYRGMSPDVLDRDHLTAYRPPGTSFLWAGLYVLVGHRYDAVRLLNCVLGAATIPVVYGIGLRAFGRWTGLLAAALFAFWPHSLFYSSELLSEAPGTLLLLAFVLACLEFGRSPGPGWAIGAGVLLGLAILVRGNPLSMLPLVLIWALVQFRGRDRLYAGAISVLGFATLLPWSLRNAWVFGTFVLLSNGSGDVLLGGNNRVVATDSERLGYWVLPSTLPEYRGPLKETNDEVKRDRLELRLAARWLSENRELVPRLMLAKFLRSWSPLLSRRSPPMYRIAMLITWGPVLLLSTLAFIPTWVAALRQGQPSWIIHLTILHFVLNTFLFYGVVRFRYPIEGLCLILAAESVVWTWDLARRLRVRSEPALALD